MRSRRRVAFTIALFLAFLSLCAAEGHSASGLAGGGIHSAPQSGAVTTIPDVHFLVFRFGYDNDSLIGFYEFSQPLRKSLPQPGYTRRVNIYYDFELPSDFGWVDVTSRLTGQRILRATSWWMGTGAFEYPPDSLMSVTLEHGYMNPGPDTLVSPGIMWPTDVEEAWALVQDTDAVARLASYDDYEVYAWAHSYRDIYFDIERFIIVATHPPIPDDMAILDVVWPRTLVTRGLPVTPEVLVHNFGDSSASTEVTLTVAGEPGGYFSARDVIDLPADESRTLTLHPINIYHSSDVVFEFAFRDLSGQNWVDAYPDNDTLLRTVQVTDDPVFRFNSTIPTYGLPYDFDDDGDVDIVKFGSRVELWQNDGSGLFTEIGASSSFGGRTNPTWAVCEDFNGDDHSDLFVSYSNEPGQLLAGDGTGVFTDVSETSGLGSITTYTHTIAFDKEKDGDIDVLILSPGQETLIENDGSGFFTDVTATSGITDNGSTQSLTSGDLSGDGYPDVVLTHWQRQATVFINNGDGTFTLLNRNWAVGHGVDAAIFDYDNDGDEDLFFMQYIYEPSRLYRNDGNLTFQEVTSEVGWLPNDSEMDVADVNNDGWLDVVATDGSLLLNSGGAFSNASDLLVELPHAVKVLGLNVTFADVNNDGSLDIYGENKTYLSQGTRPIGTSVGNQLPSVTSALDQNFPNPFNPSTTIRYRTGESGLVTLAIYNVVGQRVRTLVNEVQHPRAEGRIARWDGRNDKGERLASGVYFCQLVTPGFSQTRKLVLLK